MDLRGNDFVRAAILTPICFVLLLSVSSASLARGSGAGDLIRRVEDPGFTPTGDQPADKIAPQCQKAIEESNAGCAGTIDKLTVVASGSGGYLVQGSDTSISDAAGARTNIGQAQATASTMVQEACARAQALCTNTCGQVAKNLEARAQELTAELNSYPGEEAMLLAHVFDAKITKIRSNAKEAGGKVARCQEVFGFWDKTAQASLASATAEIAKAKATEEAAQSNFGCGTVSAWGEANDCDPTGPDQASGSQTSAGNNPSTPESSGEKPGDGKTTPSQNADGSMGTMGKILVGTAVVGALSNMFRSDDGGGGGGGETGGTGGTGGTGASDPANKTDQQKILDAQKDPQCKSDEAHEYAHCQKYLSKLCEIPANLDDARCSGYTNRQCGLSSSSSDVTSDPPAGLGTQMCKDAMANNFCKTTSNSGCHSCLSLRDRKSPRCAQNLAECTRQPSNNEMAHYKAVCPTDPVFSDPKWASIQPNEIRRPGQPSTTSTSSDPAIVGVNSRSLAGNLTATNNLQRATDVGGAHNFDLNDRSSRTVQELCQRGWLNNCGPR